MWDDNGNTVENRESNLFFPKPWRDYWTLCFILHQILVSFSVVGQHVDDSPFWNGKSSLEGKIKHIKIYALLGKNAAKCQNKMYVKIFKLNNKIL